MNPNSERLTPRQFKFLVALHVLGTSLFYISGGLINNAQQDAWITFLCSSVIDLLLLTIFTSLGNLDPSKNIAQIAEKVLGKYLGGFYCLNMALYGLATAATLIWYINNFMNTFTVNIPTFYINLFFTLIVIITLISNLKVLGRLAELYFPVIISLITLIIILVIPKVNLEQLFPIGEHSWQTFLKGSFVNLSYIGMPLINLLAFYPHKIIATKNNPRSLYFSGYFYGIIFLFMLTFITILTVGSSTINSTHNSYTLTMLVNIQSLFQSSENILALIWFTTVFFKTIAYYYYGTIHLVQLLKVKDEKSLILATSLILLVYSLVIYRGSTYQAVWDGSTWITYAIVTVVILPLILLVVAKLKKVFTHQKSKI